MFIIAHLHEGFALNNAIGLGVIWRTLDMMYAVFLGQYQTAATNVGPLSVTIQPLHPIGTGYPRVIVSESLLIFLLKMAHSGQRTRHNGPGKDSETY